LKTPPRLLWPSTAGEGAHELARVGSEGGWPGPVGPAPRDGRPRPSEPVPIALKLPAETPPALLERFRTAPFQVRGGAGGWILFGPLDGLEEGFEELVGSGDGSAAGVLRALRCGAGRTLPPPWSMGGRTLSLSGPTRLMAVLNITPDSFYEGSRRQSRERIEHALERALVGGADLVDVGGESTRPGAEPVPVAEELARVMPAVELAAGTGLPVSIDTRRAEVARAALAAGAVVVNDISAGLDDPDLLPAVAAASAGLVLMHRRGVSATMQADPRYDDLMGEIAAFLAGRAEAAVTAGVAPERIVLDAGLGFGKRRRHNFELYRRMAELHALGYPLLAGPSRKRHTSGPGDVPAGERLMGTAAACALLAWQGVQVLRVHDVGEMRRALETADEIRGAIGEDLLS
jgi:dihydropteroate synthase